MFLAMYYDPSATHAYESARHITNEVFLGEFVRGMHKWGSTVMVILVFLHMARTFFFGAYKYPRELNWVIGVVLLILTLVMSFTGYLLPFDQRSYWATIVGVNINGTGPLVGPFLSDFLRGGAEFGATTLSRFYAIHMLLVPGAIAALIGAHLYLVAKLGTTAPPWLKAESRRAASARSGSEREPAREGALPPRVLAPEGAGEAVLPLRGREGLADGVRRDARRSSRCRSSSAPSSGPKADPTTTTYVPRPEWYFFFLFELLRVIKPAVLTPLATIGVPTICMILLFLLPFYRPRPGAAARAAPDRHDRRHLHDLRDGLPDLPRRRRPARRTRSSIEGRRRSTRPGKLVVAQSGCLACHKIGENGNDGPGPDLTDIGDKLPQGGDPAHAREPDGADAVVRRPAARRRRPRWSTSSRSCAASSLTPSHGVAGGPHGHPGGGPGAGDVRPHRAASTTCMNSVMTAGLHHRWRERAADLAALGAGRPRARRRHRHRRPRDRAGAARRRRAARSSARTSPRRCSTRARAQGAPRSRWEWAQRAGAALRRRRLRRRDRRLRRAQLLRPRPRAGARWRASCGRAAASSCSRSRRRSGRRCRRSSRLWFDRVVPALGRLAGDPDAYAYLPSSVKRFPAPRGAGRRAWPPPG